jgi:Asp-tRNA(Asn)/Glu-tRNA(Gln) amidotransferase A subunit family amidase
VFEAARAKLEATGVKVVTRVHKIVDAAEAALADAVPVTRRINAWEGRWPLNDYRHRDVSKLSGPAQERLVEAESMTLDDYRVVLAERVRMRNAYAALGAVGQACITLTATGPAPVGLASTGDPIFACPGSILGVPAISLPLLNVDGLPLGFQVMGYEHGDATAIGIAAWVTATLTP